jgi:O-antigen ligase
MHQGKLKDYYIYTVLTVLAISMLSSVAGINIATLMLLLISPWFWKNYQINYAEKFNVKILWALIVAFCVWDVFTNLWSATSFTRSLWALQHDLRPLIFVLCLWPIFATPHIARYALLVLVGVFVCVSSVNLIATLTGYIRPGQYLWSTMHHLHGQMSVGAIFLILQVMLDRRRHIAILVGALLLLLVGMLMANERRAGYFLLIAGFPLWIYLNRGKLVKDQYKLWITVGVTLVIAGAVNSSVVQTRFAQIIQEVMQYSQMTLEQRAQVTTSVGIRLQFYTSVWMLIQQSNWLIGVGSACFSDKFSAINYSLGTTPELAKAYFANFQNPHNEYLFMLATKGVIGLVLYIAIFAQACKLAWQKRDNVQRKGLVIFVFLFMLSIVSNSMLVDMEEGHFAMLILLIFLAPRKLFLLDEKD